ncbi:MAG: hypothetical protein KME16_10660 [Scytolyngbya sp. HA4215-MV1]|nr:hypothetical protein [Scytolyngbya sp. HA4215-MV1]
MQTSTSMPPEILENRSQYKSCHIFVPDQENRLPAVLVREQYYSFFKIVKDRYQAIEISARLLQRGDKTVITTTAKGYAVWVLEPEAQPHAPVTPSVSSSTAPSIPVKSRLKILDSREQYHPCHVRVPDLEQRLAAVLVDGSYYSLLKVAKDEAQAMELATRLVNRGNDTVVIKNFKGYTVWVVEPEAYPDPTPGRA